ncbi:hypothetical protein FWC63_01365 [Candidatus Saccharibacteria bacterium]|nr:hypothetical protein [Candidatus Saccharibacteria bacterium]
MKKLSPFIPPVLLLVAIITLLFASVMLPASIQTSQVALATAQPTTNWVDQDPLPEPVLIIVPEDPIILPAPQPMGEPVLIPIRLDETPVPAPNPFQLSEFMNAMRHLLDIALFGDLSRSEQVGVLQAVVDELAYQNDIQDPYTVRAIPDRDMPQSWTAFASRTNREIVIRESSLDSAASCDFDRWFLTFIIMHEAIHMVHFEYLFADDDQRGNGAFLFNTDLYGEDPTEALAEIRRNLTTPTPHVLNEASRSEHFNRLSEYTADMEALQFVDRWAPDGIFAVDWSVRRIRAY